MVKFIATYIDAMTDGGDFVPHVMGIYDSEDSAREEVFKNMDEFWNTMDEEQKQKNELEFDREKMRITDGFCLFICWNVEKIEI